MSLLPGLSYIYRRLLKSSIPKNSLDRLPNDIIVDGIFDYLDVDDIICVRMVSRLYYKLTLHPAVWKRALRRCNIPLPPVAPSERNTIASLTSVEIERLLVRAHSLERNWKRESPRTIRTWDFDTSFYINEMMLLPGSQYLVASARNREGDQYSLYVFSMDNGLPRVLCRTPLETKACEIKAKYMNIDGRPSIVIAYVRRDYHHKRDKRKAAAGDLQNVSDFSAYHTIDPSIEFRYECTVLQVHLDTLETLDNSPYSADTELFRKWAASLPKPFSNLVSITSRKTLHSPILDEIYGAPYIAVVKGANNVVFKKLKLNGGMAATLVCRPDPDMAGHNIAIKAIKLLPQDHSIFVVREASLPGPRDQHPKYIFEIYPALESASTAVTLEHDAEQVVRACKLGTLDHIYVPDWPPASRKEDFLPPRKRPRPKPSAASSSSGSTRYVLDTSPAAAVREPSEPPPPPPLCVYAHKTDVQALARVLFTARRYVYSAPSSPGTADGAGPSALPDRHVVYRTVLETGQKLIRPARSLNAVLRVIPAARRPLLACHMWDDIVAAPLVCEVCPFIDHGWDAPREVRNGAVRHPTGWIGCPEFLGVRGPGKLRMHVTAWAWDETVGRLMVAVEGESRLYVYDFAAAPLVDDSVREAEAVRRGAPLKPLSYRERQLRFERLCVEGYLGNLI